MKSTHSLLGSFLASLALITSSYAATTVQDPVLNTVGSGDTAWSYLLLEAESFNSETQAGDPGFVAVDNTESRTNVLGSPVLRKLTSASGKAALFSTTGFSEHFDKITYKVQFATPGTYYLYMRFTMFENGSNLGHYISEDSFFVPPDFNKDPQSDWPFPRGGYVEGCCDLGFLMINDGGEITNHRNGTADDRAFWEGNFHWVELKTSQFNNPATQGEPSVRIKYEVTQSMVGQPLDFTISSREGGVTIDAFLFATHPDLMTAYKQKEVDRAILAPIAIQDSTHVGGAGDTTWPYLLLEGENYIAKTAAPEQGFIRVDDSGIRTNFLGNPVLGTNTTASGGGALFTQTGFSEHLDKITYRVQFSTAGTYYVYMRFTMFENGSNLAHYISEDSFFVPPDFNKDPQFDWPFPRGGYVEGCCDGGFLMIKERGVITEHRSGTNFWEGNFHWSELKTSQFNNPATQGEPGVRIKYEVTTSMLNKPLDFTISSREGGVTIDAFLFAMNPDLLNIYNGFELDHMLINPVSKQNLGNTVGEGDAAWWYFNVEGEDFDARTNPNPLAGFTRVDNSAYRSNILENPILGTNSTASGGGALFTQTVFQEHADKATYQVQFAKAGTYYLYMRFTMFDNGGNLAHYLNEDSFFVPPDFGQDPQTGWPLPRGGYVEGCCDGGFLMINDRGVISEHRGGTNYWEGNFKISELKTSQFNNPLTQGDPGVRIQYEVTEAMVGKPLEFTISYREGGLTIDSFIFSTNPDMLTAYGQSELEKVVFQISAGLELKATKTGANLVLSWPVSAEGFQLEYTGDLTTPVQWTVSTDVPVVNGANNEVTVPAGTGTRFFRLHQP